MNEKIKELARQAGLRFTQLMSNPMVPIVDGRETDLEKFAELIVKECAEVARRTILKGSGVNPDTFNGTVTTVQEIKQHFGIQE
jgi:hypothetical protein